MTQIDSAAIIPVASCLVVPPAHGSGLADHQTSSHRQSPRPRLGASRRTGTCVRILHHPLHWCLPATQEDIVIATRRSTSCMECEHRLPPRQRRRPLREGRPVVLVVCDTYHQSPIERHRGRGGPAVCFEFFRKFRTESPISPQYETTDKRSFSSTLSSSWW